MLLRQRSINRVCPGQHTHPTEGLAGAEQTLHPRADAFEGQPEKYGGLVATEVGDGKMRTQ